MAIKGTWKRTAAQSCLRVLLSSNGRGLPQQTPQTPSPGPHRLTHKTPSRQRVPGCNVNALGTKTLLEGAADAWGLDSSHPAGRPASALSWLYLSAGCLGVRGAPLSGCALSPRHRRGEQTAGAGFAAPRPRVPGPAP